MPVPAALAGAVPFPASIAFDLELGDEASTECFASADVSSDRVYSSLDVRACHLLSLRSTTTLTMNGSQVWCQMR
jgi:hypothetical protein